MNFKKARRGAGFQAFTISLTCIIIMIFCSAALVNGEALATNRVKTNEEKLINVDDVFNNFSIVTPIVVLEASAPKAEEEKLPEVEEITEEEVVEEVAEELPEEVPAWTEEGYSAVMYLTDTCNVRSEPTTEAEILKKLASGTKVNVIAKTDKGFYKIEDGGFIFSDYLTETEPAATTATASTSTVVTGTTGYAQLDELILSIFDKIFTSGMSDSDKIRACYVYMIQNTTYQKGMPMPGGFGDTSVEGSDSYVASAAYGCLTTGKGSCNRYSAAFVAMMRVLGYESHYVNGLTSYADGSMGGHAWAEVVIGGTAYIFDPQVEDNMLDKGVGDGYTRYWKTYSQLSSKYIKQ